MFAKGEYVVYGNKGVCLIQDISQIDIPGVDKDRLYYIMQPIHNAKGTVYLPIDSTKAVIRKVMSREEATKLIKDIPDIAQLAIPDEKRREASYKEALQTCSVYAWVSIIKTLYIRRNERLAAGKKITALDERYLKAAEHELYGELSIALGVPREDMESYVQSHMEA
ncbi:MAG: CarD family transcriptional regulator [Lachnospiraceae bacterium]|nr:CarD family transcriptional regulator [Lachnospiraceae bacterium]